MLEKYMENKQITVVLGYYGSGKSEIVSNMVLNSKKKDIKLYDLDIINPYFRNNIISKILKDRGIEYISGLVEGNNLDIPSIPALKKMNDDSDYYMDLGGDIAGIKVLKGYKKKLFPKEKTNFFMVINVKRFETDNVEKILKLIKNIEDTLDEKITGLISNTHLLNETTKEDIENGYKIVKEVSSITKIPIIFVTYPQKYVNEKYIEIEKDILYPLKLNLREEWMNS